MAIRYTPWHPAPLALLYRHVLNLDLTFHLSRKTGEVTRQIDRGIGAVDSLLRTVIFSLGPQVGCFELAIAMAGTASVVVVVGVGGCVAVVVIVAAATVVVLTFCIYLSNAVVL